jgi:hypothetical protein
VKVVCGPAGGVTASVRQILGRKASRSNAESRRLTSARIAAANPITSNIATSGAKHPAGCTVNSPQRKSSMSRSPRPINANADKSPTTVPPRIAYTILGALAGTAFAAPFILSIEPPGVGVSRPLLCGVPKDSRPTHQSGRHIRHLRSVCPMSTARACHYAPLQGFFYYAAMLTQGCASLHPGLSWRALFGLLQIHAIVGSQRDASGHDGQGRSDYYQTLPRRKKGERNSHRLRPPLI